MRQDMFALILLLALAGQSFGPAAIWQPAANFRAAVLSTCENRKSEFNQCFVEQMKAAGAPAEALAFTHAIGDEGYLQEFRSIGPIAIACVLYPFRANENRATLIINGDPAVVDVDALARLSPEQMKADPAYQAMLKDHSDASVWPGDRSATDSLLALVFADGSQEVIADYRVQAGCHACMVLGEAYFGFVFDSQGKLTSTNFNGFTSYHHPGQRAVSQKIVPVTPNSIFTLLLPANPTTGYSWDLVSTPSKSNLQFLGHHYQPTGNLIGSGGQERWSFRTPDSGEYKLSLSYRRAWEKKAAPAKSLSISVRVR